MRTNKNKITTPNYFYSLSHKIKNLDKKITINKKKNEQNKLQYIIQRLKSIKLFLQFCLQIATLALKDEKF